MRIVRTVVSLCAAVFATSPGLAQSVTGAADGGYKIAYGKRTLPKPKALAKVGERWAPYRTTASWYLWRAVDMDRAGRGQAG